MAYQATPPSKLKKFKTSSPISVYPEHIEAEKLKQKMEKTSFHLVNRFRGKIIHEGRSEQGQILNFRKE